jgi:hypothetical protein
MTVAPPRSTVRIEDDNYVLPGVVIGRKVIALPDGGQRLLEGMGSTRLFAALKKRSFRDFCRESGDLSDLKSFVADARISPIALFYLSAVGAG